MRWKFVAWLGAVAVVASIGCKQAPAPSSSDDDDKKSKPKPKPSKDDDEDDEKPEKKKASACKSKTVIDQEIVVKAGKKQIQPFRLDAKCKIALDVKGVGDTSKGYTVSVGKGESDDALANVDGLGGVKVRNYKGTQNLAAGRYAVIVQNTENWTYSIAVHVTLTTSPAD